MANAEYIIYTDGGSRGNPGPAAYGFVISDTQGNTLQETGRTIGEATNNVAEYMAPIEGLRALMKIAGEKKAKGVAVEVRMDSELIVRQMNRQYKVKAPGIKPLFTDLCNAVLDFERVAFVHVPRDQNKDADRMVNEALDKEGQVLGI